MESRVEIQPHEASWGVPEVAKYLQVSQDTVRGWIWKQTVPFVRVGGLIRFSKAEIDEWIRDGKKRAD